MPGVWVIPLSLRRDGTQPQPVRAIARRKSNHTHLLSHAAKCLTAELVSMLSVIPLSQEGIDYSCRECA